MEVCPKGWRARGTSDDTGQRLSCGIRCDGKCTGSAKGWLCADLDLLYKIMPTLTSRYLTIWLKLSILLITLDQVQLKSVRAKFHADRTKSQEGVQKSRFSSFCDFVKKLYRRKWVLPLQSDSAPFRESGDTRFFWNAEWMFMDWLSAHTFVFGSLLLWATSTARAIKFSLSR